MSSNALETRRKKLLFRAQRRGFREMDLIFGAFADRHLADLDEAGLECFEGLLAASDWQVYRWILGHEAVPAIYDNTVFARLRAYRDEL